MIAPTPFFSDRGCHIRILNSYLKLKNNSNHITLLTYPIGRNIRKVKAIRIKNIIGYSKTSPGFSFYRPFLDFMLLIKAKNQIKKNKYSLIYSHLHEGALIAILLKKIWKFPNEIIFDAQGSLVGEMTTNDTIKKDGYISKILYKIEKYIVKNSDNIITSTEELKKFMISEFGVKRSKIRVQKDIPNKTLFNKKVSPAKLKLPKGKKIVVYLGGLQKNKGVNHLIEAIPFIKDKFHFLIMGYPEGECKELASKLKVKDRITFTGKIKYEEAPSYLKLGDIAVSPKTLESGEANAKIYNYLAMGLKVVCFDSEENKKILGNKGIYAKEGSVKDLAKKINGVLR